MKRLEFLGAIGLLLAPTLPKAKEEKPNTNHNERMRIKGNGEYLFLQSSGNLGIGTVCPNYDMKLYIFDPEKHFICNCS